MIDRIIKGLKDKTEALTLLEINDLLRLKTAQELTTLIEALKQLENENKIWVTKKGKYILFQNCPFLKMGKISITKKGFGFVILERESDLYISESHLNGAIHNDYVLAEIIQTGSQKEGRVLKILKRELDNLVGEIIVSNNQKEVKLDDEKLKLNLELDQKSAIDCVTGTKVHLQLVHKLGKKHYLVKVAQILGHKDDPGVDILSIAYKYNIHPEFSPEVFEELKKIPNEITPESKIGRVDLTNRLIFTIDGADTKDIDDAISLEIKNGNYLLGVHIADVSYYVKANSALSDATIQRGTSCYLADKVIPMLPHQLSNGICSLNENKERLTISCMIEIDSTGHIVAHDIFPSFIKSHKQMNYSCVNKVIMGNEVPEGYAPYVSVLKEMDKLAQIIRKRKNERGWLNFDLEEAKVVQDANGRAIDIVKRECGAGENLIEDFMIIANETVAEHITQMQLPFIYRVHALPNRFKIKEFINAVSIFGYQIDLKPDLLTSKMMQTILDELDDKPEFKIICSMLLRSMKKAEYSKDNIGHFGLASPNYTHFTSPIRRLPDLIVHRLLHTYLFQSKVTPKVIEYYNRELVKLAQIASEREVAAVHAEEDVLDMKAAEYMESRIGTEWEGVIVSVTSYGFFVQLSNLVEGLVHISSLKGDYYIYVEKLMALIGKSTKRIFQIGQKVKIKVVCASKITTHIDFEICEETNGNSK